MIPKLFIVYKGGEASGERGGSKTAERFYSRSTKQGRKENGVQTGSSSEFKIIRSSIKAGLGGVFRQPMGSSVIKFSTHFS